ncbi:hypothetical protein [Skermania sp. ID1734]|uniref:hypothetical protein n=1 Tax=Skermania sp. ID1734 TaxID=2597516 RepID=UPI00163D4217|nr:hypothetical protein [Skermania sp. ID1734]
MVLPAVSGVCSVSARWAAAEAVAAAAVWRSAAQMVAMVGVCPSLAVRAWSRANPIAVAMVSATRGLWPLCPWRYRARLACR